MEGLDREDFYYVVKPEDALPRHVSTSQILFGYGKEALSASGTPMAVLAAGTYFGVAKEADIYAVQAHWRYQRVEDDVDVETTTPQALMEAYNHVIAKVIEKGLQGKAVVVVSRCKSSCFPIRALPLHVTYSCFIGELTHFSPTLRL